MEAVVLRKKFLDYFAQLDHKVFPSDSLIPSSDPSLLFTSAGMVQFKDYFTGKTKTLKRACSCQKCFRTTDIEKIGYTARHLSFFEMLGNFSFGDYFKEEAIVWAWEFITTVLGISKEKLYVSVYEEDEEAYEIWKKIIKEDRILKLSKETNFWKMGEKGPCGPCSEIIYDRGEKYSCGNKCSPACDCDRWIEIWNLVFTQYDLQPNGELLPLPQKNIDTGMGFERLLMVVNGLEDVFSTELFCPIIEAIKKDCRSINEPYIKIIADHARAITFLISDGVIPSNIERGYVLRRLIRRALRYAKLLGIDKPFINKLINEVIKIMSSAYPELLDKSDYISRIVESEEEKFLQTLETGMNLLNQLIMESLRNGVKIIPAKEVYKIYDTYGFPPELTKEILNEYRLSYDENEYREYEKQAIEISRATWKGGAKVMVGSISDTKTEFIGYSYTQIATNIISISVNNSEVSELKPKEEGVVVLPVTPFYGESGGQVGDTGWLLDSNERILAEVVDTKKIREDLIVHYVKAIDKIYKGQVVIAKIDTERREKIKRNHTATHLLHKALREILSEHARQHGSLVAPDRLRFDFFHHSPLTQKQIDELEKRVNAKIQESLPVKVFHTNLKEALEFGAIALFGEKYGDVVRCVMISSDVQEPKKSYSIELCGGTHVGNTSEIGLFKIISETSVASGVRRIEAICGLNLLEYLKKKENLINEIKSVLKTTDEEIIQKLNSLLSYQKKLEKDIRKLKEKILLSEEIKIKEINDITFVLQEVKDVEDEIMRSLVDKRKKEYKQKTVILVINKNDTISFVLGLTPDIDRDATLLAKKMAIILGGSAGGRKDFAQGGGKYKQNLQQALNELIKELST